MRAIPDPALARVHVREESVMRRLMEITPFPTQRDRKALKNVQGVIGVTTDGDRAWVVHCVFPGNEPALVARLSSAGFRLVDKENDPLTGMRRQQQEGAQEAKERGQEEAQERTTLMPCEEGGMIDGLHDAGCRAVNHGFWDLPADERAAAMDSACERAGVVNFYDLPPEERDRAYREAAGRDHD